MFLIKTIYKFLKKIAKSFGYELNVEKTTFTFLNIYKSYQEAISSSKNNDNYITKEYQKKTQLSDLNDLEVSDRFNIVPLFCALVLKKK